MIINAMPLIYRASIKKYIKKSHDVLTVLIAGGNTSVEGVGHLGVGGGGGGCCAVNKKPYTILAQKLTPLCKTIITTHTHTHIYIYIYIYTYKHMRYEHHNHTQALSTSFCFRY